MSDQKLPRLSDERFATTAPLHKIADEYIELRRKTLAVASLKRVEGSLYPAIRWIGNRTVTPALWEEYVASRPGAMKKERVNWTQFFKWMVGQGYASANPIPFAKTKLLTKEQRVIREVIPYQDWLKVLHHARAIGNFDAEWIWGACYECAFSMADSAMVSWDEIDLEQLVITRVRHKMRTRTSISCSVPIDPGGEFAKTLARAIERRRFHTHTHPNWPGKKEYVLPSQASYFVARGCLDQGFREKLNNVQREAGIKAVPIHNLRFSKLSLLANSGLIPTSVMAKISGHASEAMLLTYIEPDMGKLREAQVAVNRAAMATDPPRRISDGPAGPKRLASG